MKYITVQKQSVITISNTFIIIIYKKQKKTYFLLLQAEDQFWYIKTRPKTIDLRFPRALYWTLLF